MAQLSGHFTYRRLLRFTLPSVVTLIVTSLYGIVDGFFVSNFVGKTPFAALNFIMPFLLALGCVGFMFGNGGGALIAKTLGEGEPEKASRIFSMLVAVSLLLGVLLGAGGAAALRPFAAWLGADGALLEDSVRYGAILLAALPGYVLQFEFQCLFPTAGKPEMSLYVTLLAGLCNMLFDALFIVVLPWGLTGAALATALSQYIGGLVPLVYFLRENDSLLRLTRPRWDGGALWQALANGMSELLTNVSMSLIGMLYNFQLLRYLEADGVAAYGILMYVNLVFQSFFIGYSVGCAPIVSYHYGARHAGEVRALLEKSLRLVGLFALLMFCAAELCARPLSALFAGCDADLFPLTRRAFALYSFVFLFSGFTVFASSFFTALNDGAASALISALRTLVFETAAVLLLPLVWGVDGIWCAAAAADALAALAAGAMLWTRRKKYGLTEEIA